MMDVKKTSISQISFILNKKMAQGKIKEIKKLLKKYKATKLIEVKEDDYTIFYQEAKLL